jgi:Domain of unknown function (DUF4232)
MAGKALVVLGLLMAASVLNGCVGGGSARSAAHPVGLGTALPDPSTDPSHHPDAPPATRRPERAQPSATSASPTCLVGHLRAVIIGGGSNASQPFETIALRNVGANACSLNGYPTLTAYGHRRGGTDHRLPIRLRDGAIYAHPDPGPHAVTLAPGQRASFSVGTGAAYQGGAHPILITRVAITPPGCTATITLSLRMLATRPVGESIPVGVTALRRGHDN